MIKYMLKVQSIGASLLNITRCCESAKKIPCMECNINMFEVINRLAYEYWDQGHTVQGHECQINNQWHRKLSPNQETFEFHSKNH